MPNVRRDADRLDADGAAPESPLESTAVLFERIRAGDGSARDALFARYLPVLRRWAHGRLPARARGLADTDDLVQVTLIRALNRLGEFEPRREGAFLAYLRHVLLNGVREELRRAARRPSGDDEATAHVVDPAPSVVEQAIGRDTLGRYETALLRLTEEQREATILRLEYDFSYPEIAEALGKTTANAARMLVARALVTLAEEMRESRGTGSAP
jgi:RNA polymerase sigma-70 factor, ECF subfamily